MMQETQEQKKLRLNACHAENENDFIILKRKYQKLGGLYKLFLFQRKRTQSLPTTRCLVQSVTAKGSAPITTTNSQMSLCRIAQSSGAKGCNFAT
jgi:hypothetical protein